MRDFSSPKNCSVVGGVMTPPYNALHIISLLNYNLYHCLELVRYYFESEKSPPAAVGSRGVVYCWGSYFSTTLVWAPMVRVVPSRVASLRPAKAERMVTFTSGRVLRSMTTLSWVALWNTTTVLPL